MMLPQGVGFCNSPSLNFHVTKYNTKVMGHVVQAEWWEKNLSGFLWLINAYGNWQRKRGNKWNLFMKIMENRRKGR